MIALIGMRLFAFTRTGRALAPLVGVLVVLSILYGGGKAQAGEAYGVSAAILFGVLAWQTKKFLEIEIGRDDYTVYVRPEVVAEVAFNEIQASSQYPGGVTLRFARVKAYRSDKTAADADTIGTIQALYRNQTGV